MTLGSSGQEIWEFLILFGSGIIGGGLYIVNYFMRIFTLNRIIHFIYDFLYGIITGGIFLLALALLTRCELRYYHVLAMVLGIIVAGIIPVGRIRKRESVLLGKRDALIDRWHKSRLYRIITK